MPYHPNSMHVACVDIARTLCLVGGHPWVDTMHLLAKVLDLYSAARKALYHCLEDKETDSILPCDPRGAMALLVVEVTWLLWFGFSVITQYSLLVKQYRCYQYCK